MAEETLNPLPGWAWVLFLILVPTIIVLSIVSLVYLKIL